MFSKNGKLVLPHPDLQQAAYAQQHWLVKAPVGANINDVLNPVFWTHVSKCLKSLDEIRVVSFDGSWYAILLVVFADGLDVRTRLLSFHDLEDADMEPISGDTYEINWGGAAQKYRVIRKADNIVVYSGCDSRKDAQRWIDERPR